MELNLENLDIVKKYYVDLVALKEVRWPGPGHLKSDNMTIFYSGSGNGRHEHGVGFIVKESLVKPVKKFEAVDDRLYYILIEGKPSNIAIINCYAPTETADNDYKDSFYDNLERVYDMIPSSYIRILIRDQNAQVGHKRYKSSVRQVRSYRGAEVISSFRTKLANSWKQKKLKGRTRLKIENTKDREKVKSYREILNNELMKIPQNTDQNLEETWKIVKDSINKSAEEAIERRAEARLKIMQDPSPDNIEEFVKNKKAASKILGQEKREAEKRIYSKNRRT
ncbi:stress response protein NST1-like [Melanaphis sacchari]|uniref:stress response protein NST1-like n=1 Tax=Melanaphis sacchari TaxID=742174 RepID=UPI000DC149AC|nr:stress response protein NST1-like [Melanaphis sacchari]